MLVAGTDVSGNTVGGGQHRHISFLIGSEDSINKLYKDINLKEIHMVRLSEPIRQHVQQKLDFRGSDILAWCFHVEKQHTVDYISRHERLHPKTRPKESIFRHFDYLLLQQFRFSHVDYNIICWMSIIHSAPWLSLCGLFWSNLAVASFNARTIRPSATIHPV